MRRGLRLGEPDMQHNLDESMIRQRLVGYLTGKLSLKTFYDWFMSLTCGVDDWPSSQLQELINGIKLRLAEYMSGHWSKDDLRRQLSPFVTSIEASLGPDSQFIVRPTHAVPGGVI